MDLYAELIIEHSKRPLHAGLREPYDAQTHHVNPTCGDEVTLRVHLDRTGSEAAADKTGLEAVVRDLSYDAMGCSISIASTSILAEETIGHTVREALDTFEAMRVMLTSRGTDRGRGGPR